MSDFIRPEARDFLWRWRDVLAGGGMAAFGLWLAWGGLGITRWVGVAFLVFGAIWAVAGIPRARFRIGEDGPGVVQVNERRLSYFGPLDGGVMDVAEIVRLAYDPSGHPSPYWVLSAETGGRLAIPVDAAGSEELFDVFASLPGISTARLLEVLSHPPDGFRILWHRPGTLVH